MKTYTAQECIFDELAASGPLDKQQCRAAVRLQATESSVLSGNIGGPTCDALEALCAAGIIEADEEDHAWELTNFGYELVARQK